MKIDWKVFLSFTAISLILLVFGINGLIGLEERKITKAEVTSIQRSTRLNYERDKVYVRYLDEDGKENTEKIIISKYSHWFLDVGDTVKISYSTIGNEDVKFDYIILFYLKPFLFFLSSIISFIIGFKLRK